jgi:hypothetical protein
VSEVEEKSKINTENQLKQNKQIAQLTFDVELHTPKQAEKIRK